MDDIFVYLIKLPDKINEIVTPCAEGYTVYIDVDLSEEERIKAYNHALAHIESGHFDIDNIKTVQEMEIEAHGEKPVRANQFEEEIKKIREKRKKLKRKIDRYYKQMEKRQQKLAAAGYKEITVIEDGDYGEPVVRRKVVWAGEEER